MTTNQQGSSFLLDEIVDHLLSSLAEHEAFDAVTVERIRTLAESDSLANVAALKGVLRVEPEEPSES